MIMNRVLRPALVAIALVLSLSAMVLAVDYTITKQVFSSGATNSSGGDFVLQGTAQQTAAGHPWYSTTHGSEGFWASQQPDDPCCYFISGNIDYSPDDVLDISDQIWLVDFMFGTPTGPAPVCFDEANVDGIGVVIDIADLVYLVDFMWTGGPAPVSCP